MKIDKNKLFTGIKKLKKNDLIALMERAFDNMEGKTRRNVFGELFKEYTKKERTPEKLLQIIEQFYEKSMARYYYEPFHINSKNFSEIPDETDEWFDELSNYLDFTCGLVQKQNYDIAIKCFKLLFELINRMERGEEIVFADELGDWMIMAKEDYTENYIIALSKEVKSIQEYLEFMIPIIKNDSYSSFYNKVYKKVKKHSSKEQLAAINKEIKSKSIRVK